MSHFINREALLRAFNTAPQTDWIEWVSQFTCEGDTLEDKLYYLSLDASLEGNYILIESFDDLFAKAQDKTGREVYTIPLPERLLCGPDLQSCWNLIYPRIQIVYEREEDYSVPINVHLYEVDLTDTRVIVPDLLMQENLIHNTHVCNTHAVFGNPVLKLKQSFEVKNTLNCPDEQRTYYNPFNDEWYIEQLLCTPLEVIECINLK